MMDKEPKPKKTAKRKVATVVANAFRKPAKKKFAVKAVKPKKTLKRKVATVVVNKLRKPSKKKFEIKVVGPKTKTKKTETKIKRLPK